MKIIVPLASSDQSIFQNYSTIKPLVRLGSKTMIETFVENFDLNYEFIFLCRQQDLIETNLLKILQNLSLFQINYLYPFQPS